MKIFLPVGKGCPIRARPIPAQLEFSRLPHASSTVFSPALRAFRRALALYPRGRIRSRTKPRTCLRSTRSRKLPKEFARKKSPPWRSSKRMHALPCNLRRCSLPDARERFRVRDAFILQRLPSLSQFGIHRLLRRCEFHPRFLLAAQLRQDPAAQKMASMKFRRQAKRRINHFQSLLCFLLLLIKLRQPEIRPGVLRIPLQRLAK